MVRASLFIGVASALACGGSSSSPPGGDGDDAMAADAALPGDDDPDAAPESGADAGSEEPAPRIVFATSSKQNGDLGGLSGADDLCATRAGEAGIEGTFKAWMSSPDESARDRLSHSTGRYLRTDGTKVADNWNDLVDGKLDAPIDHDEDGAAITGDVWTGTLASGNHASDTCGGFDDSGQFGVCGSSTSSGGSWSNNITPFCTSALRLYCIQQ